MPDPIETISETRKITADILAVALQKADGRTEVEVRDAILSSLSRYDNLFPSGWYDPPPGGVAVLSDLPPYTRLQFDTLRKEEAWPNDQSKFSKESVGMVYASPVERKTGMFGDIGFSIYRGTERSIRDHMKTCLSMVIDSAAHAEVGMRFCDLYSYSMKHFLEGQKKIGWMTTTHDPLKINLGHTVPGSYGDGSVLGTSFEETKETIRSRRIYINEKEDFKIPQTCAFTVEARLTDITATSPNVFFHVIVTFSEGRKNILTNFDPIFKAIGMDYML